MFALLALLGGLASAHAAPWPSEAAWAPLLRDGAPLGDVCADVPVNNWYNLAGRDAAVAHVAADDAWLYVRVRLARSPLAEDGGWRRDVGVAVLLESDFDRAGEAWDAALFVSGADGTLTVWRNEVPGVWGDDPPERRVAAWAAPPVSPRAEGRVAVGPAGTSTCAGGQGDWYVQMRVPWSVVHAATSEREFADLAVTVTTSRRPGVDVWDIAGCPVASSAGPSECTGFFETLADSARDDDRDGLTNRDELAVHHTRPDDPDSDDDGLTDGDEVHVHDTDPTALDSDGGGAADGAEILLYESDPNDAGDDFGVDGDSDGDGLSDVEEAQVHGTDPDVADSDADGLVDGHELYATGTDPLDDDSDGDGLRDGEEVLRHDTDPGRADTDRGGTPDGAELTAGTDPTDPNDDFAAGPSVSGEREDGGGGALTALRGGGVSGSWWTMLVTLAVELVRWGEP